MNFSNLLHGVGIINMNTTRLNCEKVLTTSWVFYDVSVWALKFVVCPELIVEYVVDEDFIYEGDSALVATWMECNRD
jgi:hypothetical protein